MDIFDYIECLNKAFKAKGKEGFFIYLEQSEKTVMPIYKKVHVKIIHYPSKEELFHFTFTDRVPAGKEEKFKKECLKEIVTTVTYNMDKIWNCK